MYFWKYAYIDMHIRILADFNLFIYSNLDPSYLGNTLMLTTQP